MTALSLMGALSPAQQARAADLTVTVEGTRSAESPVLLALYDSADSFPSNDRRLQAQMAPVLAAGSATTVFRALPAGRYALAVFRVQQDMLLLYEIAPSGRLRRAAPRRSSCRPRRCSTTCGDGLSCRFIAACSSTNSTS